MTIVEIDMTKHAFVKKKKCLADPRETTLSLRFKACRNCLSPAGPNLTFATSPAWLMEAQCNTIPSWPSLSFVIKFSHCEQVFFFCPQTKQISSRIKEYFSTACAIVSCKDGVFPLLKSFLHKVCTQHNAHLYNIPL